jgi:integrase
MTKSVIEKHFYRALRSIGINEEERRARGIVFHSHRHFLNTWLRSHGVPGSKVRQIAGHRSQKMSDLYTHYRAADFVEVVTIQGELLGEDV